MPFPSHERVLYELNPLDEVLCQVRFPPILRIDAEAPAKFQEEIRSEYPQYAQASAVTINLAGNSIPPQVAQLMAQFPMGQFPVAQMSHEFTSRDETWKISLTRDFMALACKRYVRWEDFRTRFGLALDAMNSHYRPSFFTRIGLRFRDIFRRSTLGLNEKPWSELLNCAVTGISGDPQLAGDVESSQAVAVLRLPQEIGKCAIRSFIALHQPENEQVFVLDSDFFTEQQTETVDALTKLDALSSQADNFFRWSITPSLHRAMRPGPAS